MQPVTDFTQRNVAIDLFRAVTMFLMIFVNDLWRIGGEPEWLGHAAYNQDMLGLSDIVFPCFLVVVGMSIPFAIESRFSKGYSAVSTLAHLLTRALALLLMGVFIVNTESGMQPPQALPLYRIAMVVGFLLVWNVYPPTTSLTRQRSYTVLKGAGMLLLLALACWFRDAEGGLFQARWWGILGLIGWTYLVCALVYLFARDRLKYLLPIWGMLLLLCFLTSTARNGTALLQFESANFFDEFRALLHINNGALPAFAMAGMLLSIATTRYQQKPLWQKASLSLLLATLFAVAGALSNTHWIVSKIQETPPWVCYCTAIALLLYTWLHALVAAGKAGWFRPIRAAGTATLTCYLVPYVVYSLWALLPLTLPNWSLEGWFGILNSTLFACLVVAITGLLGRFHIRLKI